MTGRKKVPWSLGELVDFEVAVHQSPAVDGDVGRRIREGMKVDGGTPLRQRRWGFQEWLRSKKRGAGAKVESVTRFLGVSLFVLALLAGVGVIRGMVIQYGGGKAINIWVLLAGTIGIQWLMLLGGLLTFVLFRYWIGGLGWLRETLSSLVRRLAGRVSPEAWGALIQGRGRQPSAMGWRLTRMLQMGGVGFNVGLIGGLFGVLFFTDIQFYWESSLSQFGGDSLRQVTRFLASVWGGGGLDEVEIAGLKDLSGGERSHWEAFYRFIFLALLVWGLLPRVFFWWFARWREVRTLARLEFQDIGHRKLWREISKVERVVAMEGLKDGVVLLDVGGQDLDLEEIRPFLLQRLRVNPERVFSVAVLDDAREREAWEAMRGAPCGVVMLVEGWALSPKQMTALIERVRNEAGEETVLRVLVMGDGVRAPDEEDFVRWQEFIDGLRDPGLECLAFIENE